MSRPEHQHALEADKKGMSQQHLLLQRSNENHSKYLNRLHDMLNESREALTRHQNSSQLVMEDTVCDLEDTQEREQRYCILFNSILLTLRKTHILRLRNIIDSDNQRKEEAEKAAERELSADSLKLEAALKKENSEEDKLSALKHELEGYNSKLQSKQELIDTSRTEKINLQIRLTGLQAKEASRHSTSDEGTFNDFLLLLRN